MKNPSLIVCFYAGGFFIPVFRFFISCILITAMIVISGPFAFAQNDAFPKHTPACMDASCTDSSNGVQAAANSTTTVTAFGVCKKITTTRGLFVPTKNTSEWDHFLNWANGPHSSNSNGQKIVTIAPCSCGDGNTNEDGKECDTGNNNGAVCVPSNGSISCQYCSTSCTLTTVCDPQHTLINNSCVDLVPCCTTACSNAGFVPLNNSCVNDPTPISASVCGGNGYCTCCPSS